MKLQSDQTIPSHLQYHILNEDEQKKSNNYCKWEREMVAQWVLFTKLCWENELAQGISLKQTPTPHLPAFSRMCCVSSHNQTHMWELLKEVKRR